MLTGIPLLIVPFILYNLAIAGFIGGAPDPLAGEVFSMQMMSGGRWFLRLGDVLILTGLVFLFVEVLKSTRTGNASVLDHLLSTLLFIAFLVEFLLVPGAAHPVFFILMAMALVDLLAGFSVSIRSAGRDVNLS
jgi:hypothetical protein